MHFTIQPKLIILRLEQYRLYYSRSRPMPKTINSGYNTAKNIEMYNRTVRDHLPELTSASVLKVALIVGFMILFLARYRKLMGDLSKE
jgi:hypothetical protein